MILIDLCNIPKEMSIEDYVGDCMFAKEDLKMWYKFDTKEHLFYEYPMNGKPHSEERKYISKEEGDLLALLYSPVPSKNIKIS